MRAKDFIFIFSPMVRLDWCRLAEGWKDSEFYWNRGVNEVILYLILRNLLRIFVYCRLKKK